MYGDRDATGELVLKTLRAQAWERAKGEILAVAVTFYSSKFPDDQLKSVEFRTLAEEFIRRVEAMGLAE